MAVDKKISVSIIDYGLGNLFSIQQACKYVGVQAKITSTKQEIDASDAIILPGVGSFGDAISSLERLDLIDYLKEKVGNGIPLYGICLGFQLLMSSSEEFGSHQGLGVIEGEVLRFKNPEEGGGGA